MSQIYKITQKTRYDYAIGDIQGCYDGLMRLLDKINFNENLDRLWFVGDLVNRGPASLQVLRFIKNLPITPNITLGNHDLYLLTLIYLNDKATRQKDTLSCILNASDVEEIGNWLRKQAIILYDSKLNIVMSHAGIPPVWGLEESLQYAQELESALQSPDFKLFLIEMFGDKPNKWENNLTGYPRLRLICNYFTRMRYCNLDGSLDLQYKGRVQTAPHHIMPWFNIPNRIPIQSEIIFGHWASLQGLTPFPTLHAIDTGFIWGGAMTALRLQDKQRFSINWDK